jgi:hypothetical protein
MAWTRQIDRSLNPQTEPVAQTRDTRCQMRKIVSTPARHPSTTNDYLNGMFRR